MSGRVGSAISKSGIVENVGSRCNQFAICFRSTVISTSGFHFLFRGRHLGFRCRPMSGRVGSVISKSDVVDNVWVAVGISSPCFRSKVIFTSGLYRRNSELLTSSDVVPCRSMSANVGSDTCRSDMVENVCVAVEIASLSQAVPKLLPLPC